jgi:uncharacterized protein (DUF2147 family)
MLAVATPAMADPRVTGEWNTATQSARIAIGPCVHDATLLCGRIASLTRPLGADGAPVRDGKNPDPGLRSRPVLGIELLRGFRPAGSDRWTGGTIYDPERGRTFDAQLRLTGPDTLEVKGCVMIFCEAQTWRRAGLR